MSVQERVARGVRWLDGTRPGWRDALELWRLDIESATHCVLGQVFAEGAWVLGSSPSAGTEYEPDELFLCAPADWFADHGFLCDSQADKEALEDEWHRVIHLPREACGALV